MQDELKNVQVSGSTEDSDGCCGGGACGSSTAEAAAEPQPTIAESVQQHYGAVAERARDGSDNNCCGVPDTIYSQEQLDQLAQGNAQAASAGCGNPAGLAEAQHGETVLDLGSGGGIDCFLAARKVGPTGNVIGIDMTPQMVALAQENAAKMDFNNVTFKLGKMESITERDNSVDLVISNCVISLVPEQDKDAVFAEIHRVLKPGGRTVIADMVADAPMPDKVRNSRQEWVACIAGADQRQRFLDRFRNAGFQQVELLEDRKISDAELQGSTANISSITVRAFKHA